MEQARPKPAHLRLAFSSSTSTAVHEKRAAARRDVLLAGEPSCFDVVLDAGIQRALGALESALEQPWTVSALARHAGMSRAVFARKFAAALGTSPLRYLTERRMARAGQLLAEPALPLATIAERVGYVSEFAFNRAFKRHLLVPPGIYRRRILAKERENLRMAA
jgi:AraC-like DNA-binding protein